MTEVLFAFLPVLVLVFLMTKKNAMPSAKALPLSAFLVYLLALAVFARDANLVHAAVLDGLLLAWTPILIIGGAIFLFKTLDATGGLAVMRRELDSVSDNPVAQLMILGWAFPFLIEGASGFGTPAAIAAPILVGLGFNPLRVAVLALVMNSVPVSFGAVGTPTWFGFSGLGLSAAQSLEIGFKTALIHGIIAFVVPLLALRQLIKWQSIWHNLAFIFASIFCTVLPYVLVAKIDYEFPALVGGAIGLLATITLAKFGIGLSKQQVQLAADKQSASEHAISNSANGTRLKTLIKATFPLWGTILVLIVTRIPQLELKGLLTAVSPAWSLSLGSFGELSVSASLVLSLSGIFGTSESWSHSLLYVPSLIPFALVSILAFYWWRSPAALVKSSFAATVKQMHNPALALFGALVFVNLMMLGGEASAVNLIGNAMAESSGGMWSFIAPFLGALGSFFAGSATISNLTFGGIQYSIANNLGLDSSTILALQSVGAALGNMVCINNIVAVCSVLALDKSEGIILRKTVLPMLVYGLLAGLLAHLLF